MKDNQGDIKRSLPILPKEKMYDEWGAVIKYKDQVAIIEQQMKQAE